MVIFNYNGYQTLVKVLLRKNHHQGKFSFNRFPNQELTVQIETSIKKADCLIIGSITPPDENLILTLLLAHTLKKEGAKKVVFLAPYLAYTRQDKDKLGESLATELVGQLLKAAGIDKVITFDVHSNHINKLFPIPVISLSPTLIFSQVIKKSSWQDATLFAPDEGSLGRYQMLKKATNLTHPVSYFKKDRNKNGITHLDVVGKVTPMALLIDDMLDTGSTLLSCCQILKQRGAKEIVIMVTHGLFTNTDWQKLWKLGVKKIYCTNTVPLKVNRSMGNIEVLDIAPLVSIKQP